MSNLIEESQRIKQALTKVIEDVIEEKTRSCLRTFKAKVVGAPNSKTKKCEVQLVGEGAQGTKTTLSLPYSSAVSNVTVNEMVWIATTYNSWKNAVVWQRIDFS